MVNYISGLVFAILVAVGAAVVAPLLPEHQMLALAVGGPWLVGAAVLSSAIRLAAEWERAVVFRLGRFREVKGPGLFLIIPLVEQLRMVDTRVQALKISNQQVITKDNVPVTIDGVLFFRVANPEHAIIKVR